MIEISNTDLQEAILWRPKQLCNLIPTLVEKG